MVVLAGSTFPQGVPVVLRWAFLGGMRLSAITAYYVSLALGSYVAVFVALEALPQPALPIISLTLKDLSLPDKPFVYDLVSIFSPLELYYDGRCRLRFRVLSKPSYVFDLCVRDKRFIVLKDAISDLLEPFYVHRASPNAMC